MTKLTDIILKLPLSLQPNPLGKPILAVSGGRDSMLLLELYSQLYQKKKCLTPLIFHFNHKLREESNDDEIFVREASEKENFEFTSQALSIKKVSQRIGLGIEECARLFRYHSLSKLVRQYESAYVLTAHHAQDYLESVLIHWIRGGGASPLETLKLWSYLQGFFIFRPFLQLSRRQITKFMAEFQISYKEDKSNANMAFLRNRVRYKIIPHLEKEGLDFVKLWKNFHDLPKQIDCTQKISSAEYIFLDRKFLISSVNLKSLFDSIFLSLQLPPVDRAFLKEIVKQRDTSQAIFRIHYKNPRVYLWANERSPLWIFNQKAKALQDFQIKKLEEKNCFIIFYNHQEKKISLEEEESLVTFQAGMRVNKKKGSAKLKKIFQEISLPYPVRSHLPLLWNKKIKRVKKIYLSLWDPQKKDIVFN